MKRFHVNPSSNIYSGFHSICIVEDDEALCGLFARFIADKIPNAIITCISNPAHFEAFKESWYFDVLVCDIHLGTALGTDLIQSMRSKAFSTYIVAMTAKGREFAFLAGKSFADDFFEKSDFDDLIRRVENGITCARLARKPFLESDSAATSLPTGKTPDMLHWREVDRIKECLGRSPAKYLHLRKLINAAAILEVNPSLSPDDIASITEVSSGKTILSGMARLIP